jgi:hypothetical protein
MIVRATAEVHRTLKPSESPAFLSGREFTAQGIQDLQERFVEVPRYSGTCYQAANWICMGVTQGRGPMDRHTRYLSTLRAIYVYPLVAEFRAVLQGESGASGRSDE